MESLSLATDSAAAYVEHVRRRRVPAAGPIPARIMLVGEAPGADEERRGAPFVGRSGGLLDTMLADAGLSRAECFVTNVCKHRPPNNKLEDTGYAWWTTKKTLAEKSGCTHFLDGFWYNDLVAEGLADLREEIGRVRPECVVGLGNAALWALTGESGISNWRGSEMWWKWADLAGGQSIPVVPTYHPAYVLRVWEWKAAVTHDLKRRVAAKLGRPDAREEPEYRFTIPTTAEQAITALDSLLALAPSDLVCDVETRGGRIACVGFGWSALDALCIPLMHVDGSRVWSPEVERVLCGLIRAIMGHPRVRLIGQNFNYDRQYFIRDPAFGFRPPLHYDTMIGEHLLYPGMPKDLAYQASLYCKWYRFWKEEGKEVTIGDEGRWWYYNCRDCVATWEVAAATRPMLVRAGFAGAGL